MSKQFYCSVCGAELTHSRKAIPEKGKIFDLIDPHECVEDTTLEDVISTLNDIEKTIPNPDTHPSERKGFPLTGGGDKRNKADKRLGVPDGIGTAIDHMVPSEGDIE